MSASARALALVAMLCLIATAARSDGIGSFDNNRGIFGGIGTWVSSSVAPPIAGALLLEGGPSILLLEDVSSDLCLEGGC